MIFYLPQEGGQVVAEQLPQEEALPEVLPILPEKAERMRCTLPEPQEGQGSTLMSSFDPIISISKV